MERLFIVSNNQSEIQIRPPNLYIQDQQQYQKSRYQQQVSNSQDPLQFIALIIPGQTQPAQPVNKPYSASYTCHISLD
jgi:hypothetical protein